MAALSVVSGFASEVSDVAPGAVPAGALSMAAFGGAADTTATAALDSTSGVARVCVTGCFGAGPRRSAAGCSTGIFSGRAVCVVSAGLADASTSDGDAVAIGAAAGNALSEAGLACTGVAAVAALAVIAAAAIASGDAALLAGGSAAGTSVITTAAAIATATALAMADAVPSCGAAGSLELASDDDRSVGSEVLSLDSADLA